MSNSLSLRWPLFWTLFWTLYIFSHAVFAQTVQSVLWNVPDGDLPDLSQQFTVGNTLPLSWNAWTSTSYVDATETLVDLWVAAFDYGLNPFNQLLAANLSLTSPGNFAWTIAIPDANIILSAKYVLRFKAAAPSYNVSSGELSTPGFLVLRTVQLSPSVPSSSTTTSTTSSSLASSTLSITSPTTSSSTPAQTPTTEQKSSSDGLSVGAKAGIGVGVSLAVLAVVCGIIIFLRHRRVKDEITAGTVTIEELENKHGSTTHPAELPGVWGGNELAAR